jgi:hypothetical protein
VARALPVCGAWNTIVEERAAPSRAGARATASAAAARPVRLREAVPLTRRG